MKNRGFTLIELMIVIAIVAIILATAVPYFTGGSKPTGTRDFSSTGQVVHRVDMNSPRCVNGVLLKNNEPVVKNGAAVRC